MIEAVGVQFIFGPKIYDFKDGKGLKLKIGDFVLVDTAQGKDVGKVIYLKKKVDERTLEAPLKEIIKILTQEESETIKDSKKKSQGDLPKFEKVIEEHGLPIKAIFVDYSIFEDRVDLYFSSEGRIDFREIIKELSRTFHMQVRLRQIGSRDQVKLMGGYGPCGREVCCKYFSFDINKEKSLYTNGNIGKVTGLCGKLMCCLNFEERTKDKRGESNA
ncbi:MAG: stage 0 sporulation protein [Patescibacteria group bacterium]|nr:stage 0 sporulation protein [Patescibacteria group bacterium]MCL5093819.1 stage 0 sporulation protein [Patescibacteria group bacterium]